MPLLPAGALLIGRMLAAPQELSSAARRLLRLGFGLTAVLAVLAGVALLPPGRILPAPWDRLPSAPLRPLLAVCWIAALGGVALALLRFNRTSRDAGVHRHRIGIPGIPLPRRGAGRGDVSRGKALADEARQRLGPKAAGLALYRTREPVFYLDLAEPVPEFDDRESLAAAVADGRVVWVLARRRDLDAADVAATVVSAEPAFAWETVEQAGNKLVLARFGDGTCDARREPR